MSSYADFISQIEHKQTQEINFTANDPDKLVRFVYEEFEEYLKGIPVGSLATLPASADEFFDAIPDIPYSYTLVRDRENVFQLNTKKVLVNTDWLGFKFYQWELEFKPVDDTNQNVTGDLYDPDDMGVISSQSGSHNINVQQLVDNYTWDTWYSSPKQPKIIGDIPNGSWSVTEIHTSGETHDSGHELRELLKGAYNSAIDFTGLQNLLGLKDSDLDSQFNAAFSSFLANKQYNYGAENPVQDFINSWETYLTEFVKISHGNDSLNMITSFEQVASQQGFTVETDVLLKTLYDEQINDNGYFIPSQALDDWVRRSAQTYFSKKEQATVNGITKLPSVTTDQTKRVIVLNRIFNLLVLMIQILQDVAASQAERLTFLSRWQKGYTDLIAQIKTFTRNDGTVIGSTSGDDDHDADLSDIRSGMNQKMMNAREKLSAWRSVIGDEAKALQSRLNQSTDAVNQQANMATAIIQQLTTILAAIYK